LKELVLIFILHILVSLITHPLMQVLVSVFPYEEAANLCGGSLPSYISKVSCVLWLE
jgi:hypothetical protein